MSLISLKSLIVVQSLRSKLNFKSSQCHFYIFQYFLFFCFVLFVLYYIGDCDPSNPPKPHLLNCRQGLKLDLNITYINIDIIT